MGGFFLLCRQPNQDRGDELGELRNGFAELGFASPEIVTDDSFIFAAYPKLLAKSPELKRYPNGDFVFACGTCLSREGLGAAAAASIYEKARQNEVEDEPLGHYAVALRRGNKTLIRSDRFGAYHVFYNLEAGIVSSSFYAISSALRSLTLVRQSAFEYIFNGVISGNDTLFHEVRLLPVLGHLTVNAGRLELRRETPFVPQEVTSESLKASIDQSISLLDHFFRVAVNLFGDRVGSALSGGYDSRLVIGSLRRHGATPRAYVYGTRADSDVRLAASIGCGEGFALDIINKEARAVIPPAQFASVARRNFLSADGYGYAGIFHNGAETAESARRVAGNTIAFNGGGGEIFRNFFYLRDRAYDLRELLWAFYSQFDPSSATALFNIEEYYDTLEKKILELVGLGHRRLPRPTVEWLYHNFRCRSWDGKVDTIASWFGYTAMPFLERPLSEHASALPLCWKNHGVYEAKLIQCIDPRLAAYPSNYGHTFRGPPPLARRLRDYATYLRPPWLRRYTHRIKYRARRQPEWDGYLAVSYQDVVLPGGPEIVQRLFHLDAVGHRDQYSRILSLEYALRQFGGRVHLDF